MQLRLFDLDKKQEVVVEIDEKAHPLAIVDKLREMGLLGQREAAMFGVTLDEKRIAYVPAATVEQLAAYAAQKKTVIVFRRYPVHGLK